MVKEFDFQRLKQAAQRQFTEEISDRQLAVSLRITTTRLTALKEGMDEWTADEMACALGLHPVEVWGVDDWIRSATMEL